MNPTLIKDHTDVIGPPEGWNEERMGVCFHLPVKFYVEEGKPYIESEWEPTEDEVRSMVDQLTRGEKPRVRFRVMGNQHPVISLWIP